MGKSIAYECKKSTSVAQTRLCRYSHQMFSLTIIFFLFKVSISNGIAWNGEKKAFYHVDTFERYVSPLLRQCHSSPLARIITV